MQPASPVPWHGVEFFGEHRRLRGGRYALPRGGTMGARLTDRWPVKRMTMRERMLAVVQRRPHDRVPFVMYSGQVPHEEAYALVGRGNIGLLPWTGVVRMESPNCRIETEKFARGGLNGVRATLHTPEGTLTQERFYTPAFGESAAPAPRKQFVTEPKDYRVLQAYFRDVQVYPDYENLDKTLRDLGDAGIPHVAVGRTPYQALWVEWVLLEDLAYHLADAPGVVEETMALMGDIIGRQCRIAAASAAPYVVFPDNITAPPIGVRNFEKYAVPYYNRLAAMLDGRPVYVHMDGDLKPLWDAIGRSGVRGLDSMSPPPDNDTCVADALRLWPEMRVAINFPSSVHLGTPRQVYGAAREILEQGGRSGRLQIQISENMPPGAWRKSFPQIARAVEEFAAP